MLNVLSGTTLNRIGLYYVLNVGRRISKMPLKYFNCDAGKIPIEQCLKSCPLSEGRCLSLPTLHELSYGRIWLGKPYSITTIQCFYGTCECGCGERSFALEPHERVFRSQGGKLSLDNTIMVKRNHQIEASQ